MKLSYFGCCLAASTCTAGALADVSLAPIFGDHAVIQCDQPAPVWGTAAVGEEVSVSFHNITKRVVAGPDGRWRVDLDAQPASRNGSDLVVLGSNRVILHDVVVGEVWLCSGQSNMEIQVFESTNGDAEIANAHDTLIRDVKVQRTVGSAPLNRVAVGGWHPAVPKEVGLFSGVAYYFARSLRQQRDVPVGLIESCWGATPVESWMPPETLRASSAYPGFEARWAEELKTFPERKAAYPPLKAAWLKALNEARAHHTKSTVPFPPPPVGPGTEYEEGALFNGMIAPLRPYRFRGVLWYQGESNGERPGEYAELFSAMIRSWREAWGRGDFPFYWVQLPNYNAGDPLGTEWARLREAQTQALVLPNTGEAVTIDIGEPTEIHPSDKQDVGKRLALIAENRTYGINVEDSGPIFAGAIREGRCLRVYFSHADGGLLVKGDKATGFEIAGPDKLFRPAKAMVEGTTVLVSSLDVNDPMEVRYAWRNNPATSLYNQAGLPARPFRTDPW